MTSPSLTRSRQPPADGDHSSADGARSQATGVQPLPSTARLGVLGGGQLGAFFIRAAQNLGFKTAVFSPHSDEPAFACTDMAICADYRDEDALTRFAQACDAVTTEFENVPAPTLSFLAQLTRVAPHADAVAIAQNRQREKDFFRAVGLKVGTYRAINRPADWHYLLNEPATAALFPAVMKTCELGYDGKGQWRMDSAHEAQAIWQTHGRVPVILEKRLTLQRELSVMVARGADGAIALYPPVDNLHVHGILARSMAPAPDLSPALIAQAKEWAKTIVTQLDYIGILGVEFFVVGDELLVNEIAPRPHNSGHYTLSSAHHSQFDQQVRALAHWPLAPTLLHSQSIMFNVLGDVWFNNANHSAQEPDWSSLWRADTSDAAINAGLQTQLFLYGKKEPRPGRKMGHLTLTAPLSTPPEIIRRQAQATAQKIALPRSYWQDF